MGAVKHFADDARLDHPWVARYRIPLIGSAHPSWRYEVAVVVPSTEPDAPLPEWNLYGATWPTDDEAEVVGSVIDYRRAYYGERWQQQMRQRPLDADSSTNTLVLVRRADRWAYRLSSWQYGPTFVDSPVDGATVAGLVAVVDRWAKFSSTWPLWKADHPEIFAAV